MSCALRQSLYADNQWAGLAGGTAVHYGAAASGPGGTAGLIITGDNVAGDRSTTAVLTVGAPETVNTIETIGDKDFYRVTLEAGRAYEFGLAGKIGGPNGFALLDSFVELYDAGGTLLASADGGASTTVNTANSGFDALLTFVAQSSGTYYVNARAFDNATQDGPDGDLIGDYALTATDVTDAPRYIPYYNAESPLYAIDWGTQVDGTVRNPDGAESGHLTGNVAGTPDAKGTGITGKNVIKIYFAKPGDLYVSEDLTEPGLPPATVAVGAKDFEVAAVWTALAEFEKVADVRYVETEVRAEADFEYFTYTGTPGPGVSLLGSMAPPQENDEGLALFNSGDNRWNATNLAQGGFSFVTLIHEFGHGHGMAHPHDNGGHSGVMRGVTSDGPVADYTTGDFALNQGVFTMMSYEDGWQSSPYGNAPTNVGYGYLGGLMAFDIATIQDKYGVNEEWATGDNVYTLKDVNAAGTFFYSIWDAGGTDRITYGGTRDTTIDLRAASLRYEEGGGGRVSFASGIFGGFTIANGAVIENAQSGGGADTLIGNGVANVLSAGAGADRLDGMGGNDTLDGGTGLDTMRGGTGDDVYFIDVAGDSVFEAAGEGTDRIFAGASYTLGAGAAVETLSTRNAAGTEAINLAGNEFANMLMGNAGGNVLNGGAGADVLIGLGGNDALLGGDGAANTMQGGAGDDSYYVSAAGDSVIEFAGEGNDTVRTALASYRLGGNVENLVYIGTGDFIGTGDATNNVIAGAAGKDILNGAAGADVLVGFGGDDVLIGGTGAANTLQGGAGNDRYYVSVLGDSIVEAAGEGYDTIATDLAAYTLSGNVEALVFTGTGAFRGTGSGANDRIAGGAGTDQLAGLSGNDILSGNGGADTILGGDGADQINGGAGNDRLTGGAGADRFVFADSGVDTITDFAAGLDRIYLDRRVFAGLTAGALAAGAFVRGDVARDADDRILYNADTGVIRYDPDGNGAQASVQIGVVSVPTGVLSAGDFAII